MIFVTVGIHHHSFERLLRRVDIIARDNQIEDVFMQTGYTKYVPKNCEWENFLLPERVKELIQESKVIIAHAGAGTIMTVMKEGRLPIIVPRRKEYNEHNNDHQLDLASRMEKYYKAIVVKDIDTLDIEINNYLKRNTSYNYQRNNNIISALEKFVDTNLNDEFNKEAQHIE